jgi:membrane-bound serine protease (ClpP class)
MTGQPRIHRRVARIAVLLGLLLLSFAGFARADDGSPQVVVLTATGVVDSVMAGYLEDGIARAADGGAAAVLIRLNTPGGSLDATQRITSALLEASVPTIVYVSPAGGRAASAGTFITLAANLAFMAPGTNIGAASPVGSGGEDIGGTLGDKVRNDAIKNITAIAEARGRPVDWAVSTVETAASYAASEAVAAGAVDGIAIDVSGALAAADGRVVEVRGSEVTLDLASAAASEAEMNPLQGFLHLLSDPNIAFILFTIGVYGLIFELQNPNFVTGILGALALILALVGFGSLPLNLAGLLLMGLGVVLFVLETQVVSHGLLTVGGIVCFALGASALYTEPGDPTGPIVEVATPLVIVMTVTTGVLMGLIAVAAMRTRRMPAPAGLASTALPIGTLGTVQAPLDPVGTASLAGEPWTARTPDGARLPRDAAVRLVGFDGLTAIVEPSSAFPAAASDPSAPAPWS